MTHPVEAGDQGEIFDRRQIAVDGGILAGQADPFLHRIGLVADAVSKNVDAPAVERDEAGDGFDSGGLSGAIRPEHAEDGALTHCEAQRVQDGAAAESFDQLIGLDDVVHDGPFGQAPACPSCGCRWGGCCGGYLPKAEAACRRSCATVSGRSVAAKCPPRSCVFHCTTS